MRQYSYVSTAKPPVADTLLAAIGAHAERRNTTVEISGVLLFDGSRFLQVIEGPDAMLGPLIGAILTDPRHFAPVALCDRMIQTRDFGDWPMLWRDLRGTGHSITAFVAERAGGQRGMRGLIEAAIDRAERRAP